MAEGNYSVNRVEGATAPSSANAGVSVGDDCLCREKSLETCFCEVCGVVFGTNMGVSQHQRWKHSE